MKLTDAQRHIIRHALGIAQSGHEYRNHYVADAGNQELAEMCNAGLMKLVISGQHDCLYIVTDAGRAVLAVQREE